MLSFAAGVDVNEFALAAVVVVAAARVFRVYIAHHAATGHAKTAEAIPTSHLPAIYVRAPWLFT
eukprot:510822-Pyramimonas_sp.AAC.1